MFSRSGWRQVVHVVKFPGTRRLATCLLTALLPWAVHADGPLPIPSGTFVTSGSANLPQVSGQTMTVTQHSPRATLNWDSFNIDSGHAVDFRQPDSKAIALNLIHQQDPSRIRGRLSSNGEVWLINRNGILFGQGAEVNVRGLIASSLAPTDDALRNGIAPASALVTGSPAFAGERNGAGEALSGAITVEAGANLRTNGEGGRLMLFGPEVRNEGNLRAPDGQVVLAAGSEIHIRQPGEAEGSGLIVEVGQGGTVTNGSSANRDETRPEALLGQIVAERGTATLVGLSVNQQGRVSAGTAVRQGGKVRLLAREVQAVPGTPTLLPTQGGDLVLGERSVTEANPDLSDDSLAVDASPVFKGSVEMAGRNVVLERNSAVEARGGEVSITANDTGDALLPVIDTAAPSQSRIVMRSGSRIDVSGVSAQAQADRNFLTVKIQGAELKDRPQQRDGTLRGKTVTVDLRKSGTLADGTPWIGTPLADLREVAAAGLTRSNAERNSVGGTVALAAQGGIVMEQGAAIDVSGGVVAHPESTRQASFLMTRGRVVGIADADPTVAYDAVFGQYDLEYRKWGQKDSWSLFNGADTAAYLEGKDAGTLSLVAPNLQLDGQLRGSATPGLYQRGATNLTLANSLQRPFDELPRRGTLRFGAEYPFTEIDPMLITPDVALVASEIQDIPFDFDPISDPFPSARLLTLDTTLFGPDGFGNLTLFSAGRVSLAADATLDLGPSGSLRVEAGDVLIAGRILATGGDVSLTGRDTSGPSGVTTPTGSVTLVPGALIDVSGAWTNDSLALNPELPGGDKPRLPDAGSISLLAQATGPGLGGLALASGSVLRADGGAALDIRGAVTAGRGGEINLAVRADPFQQFFPVPFNLGAEVSAYGLESGGRLGLSAYAFCLGSSCGAPESARVDLAPEFFNSGGFGTFDLVATGGAAGIVDGTSLRLRQDNRALQGDFRERETGSDLRDFSSITTLADYERQPVNLSIAVKARNALNQFNDAQLQQAGGLTVGTGSILEADVGAQISLLSDTRLFIDGTISAPGGQINAELTSGINGEALLQHLPSQTLWLGANARINAGGAFTPKPDDRGLLLGELVDAGSITLRARSGALLVEQGALLDVVGVAETFDVFERGARSTRVVRREVAGDSGQITLLAAEALLFEGEMRAEAVRPGARAGALRFGLDAQGRNDNFTLTAAELALPLGARRLEILGDAASLIPDDFAPGQALAADLNGVGRISAGQLARGGFGDLALQARNLARDPVTVVPGTLHLDAGTTLTASRRLSLEASSIVGLGGEVVLAAPYLALGNPDRNADNRNPAPQATSGSLIAGETRLFASADLLDLFGHWALNGFAQADLRSTGDLRLRGVQRLGKPDGSIDTFGSGSLTTQADLTLAARQIYPVTLSEYRLAILDNPEGRLVFEATGSPLGAVLSAGGKLTAEAAYIVQGGNLLAPFGALDLQAGTSLALLPGSLTSTSLGGQIVPFGQIELGRDWVYQLDSTRQTRPRLVFSPQSNRPTDPFPESRVTLEGPTIALAPGAVIDQSGGGDLQAYEFIPGLTGTFDPLQNTSRRAILPGLGSVYAAIDLQESVGFADLPGEAIHLSAAVGELAAGTYALLPAHYALLPGAWLVSPAADFPVMAAGTAFALPGQGTVLSARRLFANGLEGDALESGFLLQNGADLARLGRFDISLASNFAYLGDNARPQDAGTLQLAASEALALDATLRAAPVLNGLAGRVEIAGSNLAVIAAGSEADGTPGVLSIDAGELNALDAASLLLGGTTVGSRTDRQLSVQAGRITVSAGAALQKSEVILAAREEIRVEEGASVEGRGGAQAASSILRVSGDGSLLRLGNGGALTLVRDGEAGTQGVLDVAAGATLVGSGISLFDASADMRIDGQLLLAGGLNLSSSRLSLGEPDPSVEGLVLRASDLEAIDLDTLILTSRAQIGLLGALDLTLRDLLIEAPGLLGSENTGETARIRARQLTLGNLANRSPDASGLVPGTGLLELVADDIRLRGAAGSVFGLEGFGGVRISATENLRGEGDAVLRASADLDLEAGRLGVTTGSDFSIESVGGLRYSSAGMPAPAADLSSLAGKLTLAGRDVNLDGLIRLPAGRLRVEATGPSADHGVTLDENARLDLSGVAGGFGEDEIFAPGGNIELAARTGDIRVAGGARLDVRAAPGGGEAGSIRLASPAGTVSVAAANLLGTGATGASFALDVGELSDPGTLGTLLGAIGDAGFTRGLAVRVRNGDVGIEQSANVRAADIALAADQGSLQIAGLLDVSGPTGGDIRLAAAEDISLTATGRLVAKSTAANGEGGNISVQVASASDGTVATGAVRFAQGSVVDLSGAAGGSFHVRAPRASLLTLSDATVGNERIALDATLIGAGTAVIEGFQAYLDTSISAAEVRGAGFSNRRYDDAASFMLQAAAIRGALGLSGQDIPFGIRPGVEIRSTSTDASQTSADLALAVIWDLSQWRFDGEPGVLTLRAAGDLRMNDILSDGFASTDDLARRAANGTSRRCRNPETCAFRPLGTPVLLEGESWSYRLVAGADFAGADVLSVSSASTRMRQGTEVGSVRVAPGVVSIVNPGDPFTPVFRPILNAVRTGTGNIDIRAGSDVILGNRASVIYTAGRNDGVGIPLGVDADFSGPASLDGRAYPVDGGAISLLAGGSVFGVDPTLDYELSPLDFPQQLVSSWLFRQGNTDNGADRATGWTVAHEFFEQGIATLAGGDLYARAEGNFVNLSLAVNAIGRQIGGTTATDSVVEVLGGGELFASAGGDIRGGVFHVGLGEGYLRAGGDFGDGRAAAPGAATGLAPVLSLGDAWLDLRAGGSLDLNGIINPTFIPQGPYQKQFAETNLNSYFLSYGNASGVSLASLGGDVRLRDTIDLQLGGFETDFGLDIDAVSLQALPPSLSAFALSGSIRIEGDYTLVPSREGNLGLRAADSIFLSRSLMLSDLGALPGIDSPSSFSEFLASSTLNAQFNPLSLLDPTSAATVLAPVPVHLGQRGAPARIQTLRGDILGAEGALLFLSRAGEVYSGREIVNLNLIAQNTDALDVTLLGALRDLYYDTPRLPVDTTIGSAGAVLSTNNVINLWGPGRMLVSTGRNVELGTSGGILSRGTTVNAALPGPGGAISLFAGLGPTGLDFTSFIDAYFTEGSSGLDSITRFMRERNADPALAPADALSAFKDLPVIEQAGEVLATFFGELRANGRAAAATTNPDYTQGDAAIKALFPLADYAGDLNLFFSQIFTIAGGDIDLLAPGGQINVGLATPPASFGISKTPSELGVVAQNIGNVSVYLRNDLNVNESRVFAADGGDILVWSNLGDIDAGRGARSAISVPANQFQFDQEGRITLSVPPPIQGSGIRAFTTTPGRPFGDTDLVTPRGVVNASEAGIESAGNITIAAVAVLGADNIKAGGTASGVPSANVGAVGAGVAGAAGAANAAARSAVDSSTGGMRDNNQDASMRPTNVSFITVEFLGFGES